MRKIPFSFLLLLSFQALLFSAANAEIPITWPSASETTLGEKRDFYVYGKFSTPLTNPGDVKIELYRGTDTSATPVRSIQSRVSVNGTTSIDDIETNFSGGKAVFGNNYYVPDLIKSPGGIMETYNKVVVTNNYYAGIIFGGATRNDGSYHYRDISGNILEDLTAGTYTILVTGLTGQLAGQTATKLITFGLTNTCLFRFSPTDNFNAAKAYGEANSLRMFFDSLPGYFDIGTSLYEIKFRWRYNNSLEVVNNTGGSLDTPSTAANHLFIYNIKADSATQNVEIGTIVAYGLTDGSRTTFHHYSAGEPVYGYYDQSGVKRSITSSIGDFAAADRLVLTRAEVTAQADANEENRYPTYETIAKTPDYDFSDGVSMNGAQKLSIYGAVRPIPSATSVGEHNGSYVVANRISRIKYTFSDIAGREAASETRDVGLVRSFSANRWEAPSIYEFKHNFVLGDGYYNVRLVGLDVNSQEVTGTEETFTLMVDGGSGGGGGCVLNPGAGLSLDWLMIASLPAYILWRGRRK